MKAEEGYIEVPGGKVWYRAVAPESDSTGATPLLCLHGGPGFTHYYLEPLEALAEHRRVIFYDQLGCGRSDRPNDVTLWTVDRFVAELAQVRPPDRRIAAGRHRGCVASLFRGKAVRVQPGNKFIFGPNGPRCFPLR